jgi:hypothetical protein
MAGNAAGRHGSMGWRIAQGHIRPPSIKSRLETLGPDYFVDVKSREVG